MAIIKRGILGGFSKKIGNIVGSSWKGIAYMKSLPLSVANPKTAGQVAQRSKFSNVTAFASALLTVLIKPLWDRFAQQMSGYNAFIQTNIDLFADALPSTFADLIISSGKMAATAVLSFNGSNGTPNYTCEWADDTGEGLKLATDVAYFLLINETQGTFGVGTEGDTRADLSTDLALADNGVSADVIHAYLAFKRADGTVVSDTAYKLGSIA